MRWQLGPTIVMVLGAALLLLCLTHPGSAWSLDLQFKSPLWLKIRWKILCIFTYIFFYREDPSATQNGSMTLKFFRATAIARFLLQGMQPARAQIMSLRAVEGQSQV